MMTLNSKILYSYHFCNRIVILAKFYKLSNGILTLQKRQIERFKKRNGEKKNCKQFLLKTQAFP